MEKEPVGPRVPTVAEILHQQVEQKREEVPE